jgi:hypothetical protein
METKLRDILMTHAAAGADRVVLEERIVDLQATVAMVSSHRSLVRALFTDIRNVLVGTVGNFVASSAIQVLNQMLGRSSGRAKSRHCRCTNAGCALRSSATTHDGNGLGCVLTIV